MKAYNPKQWFTILFFFKKGDTLIRILPFLALVCLYSITVTYVELNIFNKSVREWLSHIPTMLNLLGFVISLLLVFRTNTAYDRWWEGRKLWGALVNNSRNLAIKIGTMIPEKDVDNRLFFKETIPLYAFALKEHLQAESTRLSLDELEHPELEGIDAQKHVPNQVAMLMIGKVHELYAQKTISGDQLIILNGEISSFTDICGACERIKNTPIPFSYSSFIKKFILFYVLILPLGYSMSMGYVVTLVVCFVFYVLGSLELIAEEIEDPFGKDPNDLPMEKIATNIKKHVGELL